MALPEGLVTTVVEVTLEYSPVFVAVDEGILDYTNSGAKIPRIA